MKIIKYNDAKELNAKLEKTIGKLAHRKVTEEGSISPKLHSVVQLIQENRELIDNSNDSDQLLEFLKSAKQIEDLTHQEHSEEDAEVLHRCMIAATGALLLRNDPADKASLSEIDPVLYFQALASKIEKEKIMLDSLQLTQEETMQLAPYLTHLKLSATNENYDSAFIKQFLGKTEKLKNITMQLDLEADAFELLENCEKLETITLIGGHFNGPLPERMPSLKKIQLLICKDFNHPLPRDLPALETLSINSCRSFNQPLPEEMRSLTELTLSMCPSFNQPLPRELGSLKKLRLSSSAFNQPLPESILNIETCEISCRSLDFMHVLRLLHPLYLENKERAKEIALKTFHLFVDGLIALYPFITAHPGHEEEIRKFARFLYGDVYAFLEKKNVPPSIEETLREDPIQKLYIYQLCSKMPEGHSMEDIEAFLNLIIKTPMDETLKDFYFNAYNLNNQIIPLPAHDLFKNASHEKRLQYMEYLDLSSPSNEAVLQNLENLENSQLFDQFHTIFKKRPPILSTQGLFTGDPASDRETLALLQPPLLLELEPRHAEALLKTAKGRELVEINIKQFFELKGLQELLLKTYPPEDPENLTIYNKMPPPALLQWEEEKVIGFLRTSSGRAFVMHNVDQIHNTPALMTMLLHAYPLENPENMEIYSKMHPAGLLQWEISKAIGFLMQPSGRDYIKNNLKYILGTPDLIKMLMTAYPPEDIQNIDLYLSFNTIEGTLYLTLLQNMPFEHPDVLMDVLRGCKDVTGISIKFIDSQGIDSGGLGRQFVSQIIQGIVSRSNDMKFAKSAQGMIPRPTVPMRVSAKELERFETLGSFFALAMKMGYPTGEVFHPQWLECVLRCVTLGEEQFNVDAFFSSMSHQELSSFMKAAVPHDEPTMMELFENAEKVLCSNNIEDVTRCARELNKFWESDELAQVIEEGNIDVIRTVVREEWICPQKGYVELSRAVANGIHQSMPTFFPQWFECLRRFSDKDLSEEPFNIVTFFSSMNHQEFVNYMKEIMPPHDEPSAKHSFEIFEKVLCSDDWEVLTQLAREIFQFQERVDEGNIDQIREEIREELINSIRIYIETNRETAKGLRQSLPQGQPITFSYMLQGSLSSESIKKNLTFEGADDAQADKVKTWIFEWIDAHKNDKQALANLLQYLTGARAIARPITFTLNPHVEGIFPHTCFYKIDLPPNMDEATLKAAFDEYSKSSTAQFTEI